MRSRIEVGQRARGYRHIYGYGYGHSWGEGYGDGGEDYTLGPSDPIPPKLPTPRLPTTMVSSAACPTRLDQTRG